MRSGQRAEAKTSVFPTLPIRSPSLENRTGSAVTPVTKLRNSPTEDPGPASPWRMPIIQPPHLPTFVTEQMRCDRLSYRCIGVHGEVSGRRTQITCSAQERAEFES